VVAAVIYAVDLAQPSVPACPPAAPSVGPKSFEELTPRELEVLSLIARGLRNREIAGRLGAYASSTRLMLGTVLEHETTDLLLPPPCHSCPELWIVCGI
jgi:hypothetical protein